MWIPQTSFSLVLTPDVENPWVLDIHPTRWSGAIDHGVYGMLARFCTRPCYPAHQETPWSISNPEMFLGTGYKHLDYAIGPGGLCIHRGAPLPNHFPIHVTDQTITMPDGSTYPVPAYVQGAHRVYHCDQIEHSMDLLRNTLTQTFPEVQEYATVAVGVYAGLLDAAGAPLMDYPNHMLADAMATITAFTARHLASFPRAGQTGIDYLHKNIRPITNLLMVTWGVRPNQGWMPTHWEATETLSRLEAMTNAPTLLAAAKAAGSKAYSLLPDPRLLMKTQFSSSHEKLVHKTMLHQIETAFFTTINPALLKPQARHKALRLQSS